jgi:hypothetical protein
MEIKTSLLPMEKIKLQENQMKNLLILLTLAPLNRIDVVVARLPLGGNFGLRRRIAVIHKA